eukprot:scaffold7392_cov286-Pinguiococcus_pyrenoidosus.AAC.4
MGRAWRHELTSSLPRTKQAASLSTQQPSGRRRRTSWRSRSRLTRRCGIRCKWFATRFRGRDCSRSSSSTGSLRPLRNRHRICCALQAMSESKLTMPSFIRSAVVHLCCCTSLLLYLFRRPLA